MKRACTKCNILVECGEIKPVTKIFLSILGNIVLRNVAVVSHL